MTTGRHPEGSNTSPLVELAASAGVTADLSDEHARWALYLWAFDHDDSWPSLLRATQVEPDPALATGIALEMIARVPDDAAASWVAARPDAAGDLVPRRAREMAVLRHCQRASAAGRVGEVAEWSDWLQRRVSTTSPDLEVLERLRDEGRTRRVRAAAGERLKHPITSTRFDGAAEPITSGMPTCGLYQVRMPDGGTVQLHDMDLVSAMLTDDASGRLRLVFRWAPGWAPRQQAATPLLVVDASNVVIEGWSADPDPSPEEDVRSFGWDGARAFAFESGRRALSFYADVVRLAMAPEPPEALDLAARP